MTIQMIFGLQFFLSLFVFALIAWWFADAWIKDLTHAQALSALIIPHAFRHLGLAFQVPGLTGGPLPEQFAAAAAYGDLLSGLLALVALAALHWQWRYARPLVWLFSVVGTADLLNALRQAEVIPFLGTTWYIPTFVVPLLLVTHFMIFRILLRRNTTSAERLVVSA